MVTIDQPPRGVTGWIIPTNDQTNNNSNNLLNSNNEDNTRIYASY